MSFKYEFFCCSKQTENYLWTT